MLTRAIYLGEQQDDAAQDPAPRHAQRARGLGERVPEPGAGRAGARAAAVPHVGGPDLPLLPREPARQVRGAQPGRGGQGQTSTQISGQET